MVNGKGKRRRQYSLAAGQDAQAVRTSDHLIKSIHDVLEAWPRPPVVVPTLQHQLMHGLGAAHGRRQPIRLLDRLDHVLVGPVPIRPLTERHHLPHEHTERPDVGGRSELAVMNRLWSSPPHRDFAALEAEAEDSILSPLFSKAQLFHRFTS